MSTRKFGNLHNPPATSQLRVLVAARYGIVGAAIIASPLLAGCTDTIDGQTYCVDPNNRVVEQYRCDNSHGGGGGFFLLNSSRTGAPVGSTFSDNEVVGGTSSRVPANDSGARAKAGISANGTGTGKTTISRGGLGAKGGSSSGS